jgi:hypothetical protein
MTMTSVTLSARKPASSRYRRALAPRLLAGALLLAGCARDPIDEAAWQASRVGTAFGDHPEKTRISGIEAGSRIVERYYFVAKYEATLEQRRIAEVAGRKAEARVRAAAARPAQPPPPSGIGELQMHPSRYLAVPVRHDRRARTRSSVMIWDTQAQDIVGNSVYDINSPPPTGASVKFETFWAEYIGSGE